HAPWFVVPADRKWFTRIVVAAAVVEALEELDLQFPKVDARQRAELRAARRLLERQGEAGASPGAPAAPCAGVPARAGRARRTWRRTRRGPRPPAASRPDPPRAAPAWSGARRRGPSCRALPAPAGDRWATRPPDLAPGSGPPPT